MSSAIFHGIVTSYPGKYDITVSGPHLEKLAHFAEQGAHITSDNSAAFKDADVVFLGVKPQMLTAVLNELKDSGVDYSNKLLVSMAAGFKLAAMTKILGECAMIRIMPNTPSKIGLGVTAVCPGAKSTLAQQELLQKLLAGMGKSIITDEPGLNAIGAIVGSGPAFVFRFMEALVSEAERYGFSKEEGRAMVEQLLLGSVQLAKASPDQELGALREAVTSKGGTTYQGLLQMTEYHFEEMMQEVIKACLQRTKEFEDMF